MRAEVRANVIDMKGRGRLLALTGFERRGSAPRTTDPDLMAALRRFRAMWTSDDAEVRDYMRFQLEQVEKHAVHRATVTPKRRS